jgi:hypothetical protein
VEGCDGVEGGGSGRWSGHGFLIFGFWLLCGIRLGWVDVDVDDGYVVVVVMVVGGSGVGLVGVL